MPSITAFVLAGGKSTRMGRDKALLELGGRPLIAHMLEVAQFAANDVRIVGDPAQFSKFAPVVQDVYIGHGPLGGIHAALESSCTDLNLILGVDLPFIEARFLSYLASQASSSNAVVTIPVANAYLQTLCAFYRKDFAAFAREALGAGRNKVDAVFPALSVHKISEDELTQAGFDSAMFRNLNTPDDWKQAAREFESASARARVFNHTVKP